MTDDVTHTITEYNDLRRTTTEIDRLLEKAMSENFAANHLISFRSAICEEMSVLENRIITSRPANDFEAAEQIKFISQIMKQKISDRQFDRHIESSGVQESSGTPKLLEIAKTMADVAQQL